MDAKNKVNFINSTAGGEVIYCTECGAQNKPHCRFCTSCGQKLIRSSAPDVSASSADKAAPAFQPVTEESFGAMKKPDAEPDTAAVSDSSAGDTAPAFQLVTSETADADKKPVTDSVPAVSAAPADNTAPVFQAATSEPAGADEKPVTDSAPTVSAAPTNDAASVFQPADAKTEKPSEGEKIEKYEDYADYAEPVSVFADGLPAWDIVPPQVMVRRKRRT